jgi:RND family efflux transporter MFP subunit
MMKVIVFILPFACLGLLCSCGGNTGKGKPIVKNVHTIHAESVAEQTFRSFPGVVKAAQQIDLGFKTAGQIREICIKEGDYVREGQILARLDDADYQLQLTATESQYRQLSSEMERLEKLYWRNNITGNDYEKAVAGLEQLKVQLESSRNTVNYTQLRSPASGYIQAVHSQRAEMVNTGTAVVTLIDTKNIEIETELPASVYLQKDRFTSYSCHSTLLPGSSFPLTLASINPKSNSNQLYKMRLLPEGATAKALSLGMNVEVVVEVRNGEQSGYYTLPSRSVFTQNGQTYVWIVNRQSEVESKAIEIFGIDRQGRIIVSSGIDGSDHIVESGLSALSEGDKVQVVAKPAETNIGGIL